MFLLAFTKVFPFKIPAFFGPRVLPSISYFDLITLPVHSLDKLCLLSVNTRTHDT